MNIIVYVVDSLRADHLSSYGYHRQTSPHLDELADEGLRFRDAYSTSTWTREAAASLLSGLYPSATGVRTVYDSIPTDLATLPELLREADFRTVGLTSTSQISNMYGFDKGFDRYDVLMDVSDEKRDQLTATFGDGIAEEYEFFGVDADRLHEVVLRELERTAGDFFGLIWTLETHDPFYVLGDEAHFSSGPAFPGSVSDTDIDELIDVYDDMVLKSDRQFGNFVNELKAINEYEDTLLFFVSDHGESLGEHGARGHSGFPYAEKVEIPFIVKPTPGIDFSASRLEAPVQITDIVPTILDGLGLDVPPYLQGRSLLSEISPDRPIFTETKFMYNHHTYESLQRGEYKYVQVTQSSLGELWGILRRMIADTGLRQRLSSMNHTYSLWSTVLGYVVYRVKRTSAENRLFHLKEDRDESTNLLLDEASFDEIVAEYTKDIEDIKTQCRRIADTLDEDSLAAVDEETKDHLADLGYRF